SLMSDAELPNPAVGERASILAGVVPWAGVQTQPRPTTLLEVAVVPPTTWPRLLMALGRFAFAPVSSGMSKIRKLGAACAAAGNVVARETRATSTAEESRYIIFISLCVKRLGALCRLSCCVGPPGRRAKRSRRPGSSLPPPVWHPTLYQLYTS